MLLHSDITEFIQEAFEQNFELLSLESGHTLSADVKETAFQQVKFYWQKLRDTATRVSETEVRLNLPNQVSPQGRKFGIEGVVDIVRDDEQTVMYDIKTHEADYVRDNIADYERQLNVYAHIWCSLRNQRLDGTAIIATAYPDTVREALNEGNPQRLEYEVNRWEPLVEIEFNPHHVADVIADFGRIVDCIENGEFAPAPMDVLVGRREVGERAFASRVCRRCDARFSCDSYRQYAITGGGRAEQELRRWLEDYGEDVDREEWLSANLGTVE